MSEKSTPPSDNAALDHAMAVQEKYRRLLMSMPGVVGLGVGYVRPPDADADEIGVIVLTDEAGFSAQAGPRQVIPTRIDGVAFEVQNSGSFNAFG